MLKDKYNNFSFIGNIDITYPLSFGNPQQVKESVNEHLINLADAGGYVLSSSHSIINKIPPANFEAMLKPLHTG